MRLKSEAVMIDNKNSGVLIIPNEQFDWMIRKSGILSKREIAVLLAVIRFTFGFHRKEARLSGSYLEKATGILARHIPGTLKKLSEKKLITVIKRADKNTNIIRFDWTEVMKEDTPNSGEVIPPKWEEDTSQNGSKVPPKLGDKTVKKTIKKYNTEETEDIDYDEEVVNPFM